MKLCFGDQRTSLSLEVRKLNCTFRRTDCVLHTAFPRVLFSTSTERNLDGGEWIFKPKQSNCKSRSFGGRYLCGELKYYNRVMDLSDQRLETGTCFYT